MINSIEVLKDKLKKENYELLRQEWIEINTVLKQEFPIHHKGFLLFKQINNNIKNPNALIQFLKELANRTQMTGGAKNSKEGNIKKNEIKTESENDLKMHQLKDIKDIPKMYYSIVTEDEYKKYMDEEIQKMNRRYDEIKKRRDNNQMSDFELKVESEIKKSFEKK